MRRQLWNWFKGPWRVFTVAPLSRLDGVGERWEAGGHRGVRELGGGPGGDTGEGGQGQRPPDCSVALPPVCRKFLAAHPAERGPVGGGSPRAWGQRGSIWLSSAKQSDFIQTVSGLSRAYGLSRALWADTLPRVCGRGTGWDQVPRETLSLSLLQGQRRSESRVVASWPAAASLPGRSHLPDPLVNVSSPSV